MICTLLKPWVEKKKPIKNEQQWINWTILQSALTEYTIFFKCWRVSGQNKTQVLLSCFDNSSTVNVVFFALTFFSRNCKNSFRVVFIFANCSVAEIRSKTSHLKTEFSRGFYFRDFFRNSRKSRKLGPREKNHFYSIWCSFSLLLFMCDKLKSVLISK